MSNTSPTENDPFNILALSSGGYKGLYTAHLISLIEARTSKLFGSHFDLVCGTSIGGIIALAVVTRKIPAKKVEETLKSVGPQLFTSIEPPRFQIAGLIGICKGGLNKLIYKHTGFTFDRGISAAKHINVPLEEGNITTQQRLTLKKT